MGERTLVIGDVPVGEPPRTLMVAWGDWVGACGAGVPRAAGRRGAVAHAGGRARREKPPQRAAAPAPSRPTSPCCRRRPASPPALLRAFARGSLLWMVAAIAARRRRLAGEARWRRSAPSPRSSWRPEAAAWCVLRAFAARASIEHGVLVLTRGARRLELALHDIVAVEPWRVPIPSAGACAAARLRRALALRLAHRRSGRPGAGAGGGRCAVLAPERPPSRATTYAQARLGDPARSPRPSAGEVRAVSAAARDPGVPAAPAHRVRQHASASTTPSAWRRTSRPSRSGGPPGRSAWCCAPRRCAPRSKPARWRGAAAPGAAPSTTRRWLERLGLAALYLGVPAWLLLRAVLG